MQATRSNHAWQRLLPLWHGTFYGMLALSLIVTLIGEPFPAWEILSLILALTLMMGIWYGMGMTRLGERFQQRPYLRLGYLVLGWLLWFGMTLLNSSYMLLLFGLFPQVFLIRPMIWRIVCLIFLTSLTFIRQVLMLGWQDGNLFITPIAALSGLLMTVFIEAIIRQSNERHSLLEELAATRRELAVAERQAGITQERQRLAREIHDTLVQGFASIVMHLEVAEAGLTHDVRACSHHLDQARRAARENLTEARRLMWALQPEALDHASLPEVLMSAVKRWSEESGLPASTMITGTTHALRPEIEVALLRGTQEALTNIGKHAQASQVTVTLTYMEDLVSLDVQDDGKGFNMTQILRRQEERLAGHSFGLKALRERVEQLHGTLSIESAPGEGTTLQVTLPDVSREHAVYSSVSPANAMENVDEVDSLDNRR